MVFYPRCRRANLVSMQTIGANDGFDLSFYLLPKDKEQRNELMWKLALNSDRV